MSRYHRTAGLDQLAPPPPRTVRQLLIRPVDHFTPRFGWRGELDNYKAGQTRRKTKRPITLPQVRI